MNVSVNTWLPQSPGKAWGPGGLGRQLSVEDSGREPGVTTGDGEPWVGGGGELRPGLMGSGASPVHSLPASPAA